MANRQYPQVHMKACGWADHDKCLVCLSNLVDDDEAKQVSTTADARLRLKRSIREKVVASDEQMDRARLATSSIVCGMEPA